MILGLDPSLTGTGVAIVAPVPSLPIRRLRRITTKPAPIATRTANVRARRIGDIIRDVEEDVKFYRPALAVVEAPVPNGRMKSAMLLERGAVYWGLLDMLDHHDVEIVEAAPKQRALYATGDGAADKVSVVDRMVAEHGVDTRDDNEIDALVLAMMGCRIEGMPADETTEYRTNVAADLAAQIGRSV